MLVLSRKVGETIVIGGQVLVTVRNVRSKSVSLGIVAPEDVPVDRSEIHARKRVESGSPGDGDLPVRPNSEIGADLLTAIQRLVADAKACGGPEIEFCHDFQDYALNPLSPCLERAAFRIVQECVANACRHGKSKQVLIGLSMDDDSLYIEAQDRGIGFDAAMIGTTCLWLEGNPAAQWPAGRHSIHPESRGQGNVHRGRTSPGRAVERATGETGARRRASAY